MPNGHRLNKRYNRIELEHSHVYLTNYGTEPRQDVAFAGLIKCKLIHARWGSILVPDQVYLDTSPLRWIQPLAFAPCVLAKMDENAFIASLWIDISCGQTVRVKFGHDQLRRKCPDGSELFECTIHGPNDLEEYATGEARITQEGVPELLLYHHTAEQTKPLILGSKSFRGSKWNIQGNKELTNVSYAYFTCLDQIETCEDLIQIAMASDGKIHLIRDDFDLPLILNRDTWREQHGADILELDVYRESTANRTATVAVHVDSTALASQHLHFHRPSRGAAYYEVCKPFIYRVGMNPGDTLPIDLDAGRVAPERVKRFAHIVAGDATTLDGLRAPFDEEHTDDIFKVEHTPEGHSALSFWFTFPNSDHFSGKPLEPFEFKK